MEINLGTRIMVSDPCYRVGTWCQGVLDNVLPGKYNCEAVMFDEGEWGTRVGLIKVVHEDYGDIKNYEEEPFEVGVDSGQAGVFDLGYYKQCHNDKEVYDDWYKRVCDITLSRTPYGVVDNAGFVSESGYGDGGYGCWTARNRDGHIVGIRIEFILEEDEYDEDEE